MKVIVIVLVTLVTLTCARPQHQQQQNLDPSYLQQYYSQLSHQSGQQRAEATPIYESSNQEEGPQYTQQGQQIRVKDNVGEQARQQVPHPSAYVAPSVRQQQQIQQVYIFD